MSENQRNNVPAGEDERIHYQAFRNDAAGIYEIGEGPFGGRSQSEADSHSAREENEGEYQELCSELLAAHSCPRSSGWHQSKDERDAETKIARVVSWIK